MKQHYYACSLAILFCAILVTAHAQNVTWVKHIDSLRKAPPFYLTVDCSMAKDANDNLYITGPFQDSVDVDPGPAVNYIKAPDSDYGSFGLFLTKYNSDGDLQWVRTLDGSENYRVTPTDLVFYDDAIYVSGFYSDTVDFDPGPGVYNLSTASINAGFIAKYDDSGNLIWAKAIATPSGISSSCDIRKIKLMSGHLYFGGSFKGTIDFDGSSNVVNLNYISGNFFTAKYDTAGNYIWVKNFGPRSLGAYTTFGGIALDASENVWVTGSYDDDTIYFSSSAWGYSNSYSNKLFLAKFDGGGNYQSVKLVEGVSSSTAVTTDIETDQIGNVYLTGWYFGIIDFDPGPDTAELQSLYATKTLFVAKYDTAENLVWVNTVIGDYNMPCAIAVDAYGLVSIAGFFESTLDFGNLNALYATGDYDMFVAVYDQENGNFLWADQLGPGVSGVGYCDVISGNSGDLYVMGTPTDPTYCNTVFARYNQYQTIPTQPQSKTVCSGKRAVLKVEAKGVKLQYQWKKEGNPIAGATADTLAFDTTLVDHSGKYSVSVTSPFGVIESDTVLLMVNPSYKDTVRVEICEGSSFVFGPYVINLPGVYDRLFQTVNGCDSMVNLTLSFKQVYNEVAIANACDYYIFGGDSLKLSGVYNHTFEGTNGCDSNVTLTLSVSYSYNESISIDRCESFVFGEDTLTTSGSYDRTFLSINGCDSTVNLTLAITHGYNENKSISICRGSTYLFGATTITAAGTYTELFSSKEGCDSMVHLSVTVKDVDTAVTLVNNTLAAHASPASYQWLNCTTQSPVIGETNQSYTPSANGMYAVIVTENGCSDTSFCYAVTHVGINEIIKPEARLYPNPSTGLFYVELEHMGSEVMIQVYDPLGKVVYTTLQQGKHFTLDLNKLGTGMYFVLIKDENNQLSLPVQIR